MAYCHYPVDYKNFISINLDYGIGMGIMINSQLYYGKSGFSGEFGHIRLTMISSVIAVKKYV